MAYELYQRRAARVDTPTLSITPGGKVAVNAAACRLLIEAGIKAVVILWDKASSRMAVKAASKGDKNSFTVTFSGGRHSGTFAAKSFLRHIGWNATKREMLPTTWDAAGKMFEASLPPEYVGSIGATTKRKTKTVP